MVSVRPRTGLRQAVRRNGYHPVAQRARQLPAIRYELVLVVGLVAYALAARILVAVQLPPWQGPDEPKHFEYIRMLVDKRDQLWSEHRLLEIADAVPSFQQQVIESMARNNYWPYVGQTTPDPLPDSFYAVWRGSGTELHRPSVYYFTAAVIVGPLIEAPLEQQLLAVRIYSAVLGALTVLITYLAGRAARRSDPFLGLVAAAFVATLPMNVFVGGIVTVDNLAILIGGVLALALARGFGQRFSGGVWLLIVASVVLGLATKREFVGVLPALFMVFLVWGFRQRGVLKSTRNRLITAGGVLALAAGAIFAVRSESFTRLSGSISDYALNESDQVLRLLHPRLSTDELLSLIDLQRKAFFSSFWGVFGWFTTPLDSGLETGLKVVSLLCAIGLVIWLVTNRHASDYGKVVWLGVVYGVMVLTLTLLAFGIALSYFSIADLPQGRQIFGVLVPIALLAAIGARGWLSQKRFGALVPAAAIAVLLVVLDVVVYFQVAPWFFRQDFS